MAGIVALGALAAAPGAASAVDRYVDAETGSDSGATCAQANPCDTIGYALSNSGAGDEVFVDNGSYAESVTLGDARSLTYMDFVAGDGAGPAIVDGGAGNGITVAATGAGHIRGLTVRGDGVGVLMNGPAEVDGNTFDEPDSATATGLQANSGAAGSQIHDNSFSDPAPSTTRPRVGAYAAISAVDIVDNDFTGLQTGVAADGAFSGTALIEGNEVTGTHNLPFAGASIRAGPIGPVTVRENEVSAASGSGVTGIFVASGATLMRNEITGHQNGVFVFSDSTNVSLEGDRIWGNTGFGLDVFDNGVDPPQTSVTATNVTAVENDSASMFNVGAALTINSSITDGMGWGSAPTTCAISFSRGNTTANIDPSNCDDFTTDADPMLVDPANGDLHLEAGSPMLDMGDPADPPAGSIDLDGDPRAVDATPECSGNVDRRDIGADEFVPAAIDCDPPDTTFTKTPPKKTKKKTVRFKFEADEPGTFECRLDQKPEYACGSPEELNVSVGRHKFFVTATDNASNVEVEAPKYGFRRVR